MLISYIKNQFLHTVYTALNKIFNKSKKPNAEQHFALPATDLLELAFSNTMKQAKIILTLEWEVMWEQELTLISLELYKMRTNKLCLANFKLITEDL